MTKKRISLALQGGGALGAYTWGVLDRLLADERIEIAAISGASAGAMCAVVLAEGYEEGGAAAARRQLRTFWKGVAEAGLGNPYLRMPMAAFLNAFTPAWLQGPTLAQWADAASRFASPYDLNPLNINPLRDLLNEIVDFERVRACKSIELFIGATNVETGRARVFNTAELTADHIMASACLPQVFQAVTIDGAPYWDGGFTGNPPLFPLFQVAATSDIVIVQVQPLRRSGAPQSAGDIGARLNEITFNQALLGELRAIEFVGRLVDEARVSEHYRKMLIHNVSENELPRPLKFGVDFDTNLAFFEDLRKAGHSACAHWLDAHFEDLGARSTVDLAAMFADKPAGAGAQPMH